jgi:tetratricopeptide (TPR) repeat protein
MDFADDPNEPFTLFNLGWSTMKLGGPLEALPYLEKSLKLSTPGDSIVRKIYALLVQCHTQLGNLPRALELCRDGRCHFSDDAELLFEEGSLNLEQGNLSVAERCFLKLLTVQKGAYFASIDPDLTGYKSRHLLGVVHHKQHRLDSAKKEWLRVLNARPDHLPTHLSLAELEIERQEWNELESRIRQIETLRNGEMEAVLLRARAHMARKEFGAAKALLATVKSKFPNALAPRVVLSHALLQENVDLDSAEAALRDVLTIEPNHRSTAHNLRILLQTKSGRPLHGSESDSKIGQKT